MTDIGPIPPTDPTPNTTPPIDPAANTTPPPAATPTPGTAPLDYGAAPGMMSAAPYTGPAPTADDKTMAMLAHLLGILGFVGPLVIWLIKKDQSQFVADQAREALNFHLTLLIGIIIGGATVCLGIGLVIIPAVWIVGVIFSVLGGLKAKDGIAYRYPFAIRMIK